MGCPVPFDRTFHHERTPRDRRTVDRPVRQDAAAGDRAPRRAAARANIAPFAELERSPEHIHTYRITPLALWNARAAGHDAEQVVDALVRWSRFPVPQALLVDVVDTMSRYGRLVLQTHPAHGLIMVSRDKAVLEEILRNPKISADARRPDRRRTPSRCTRRSAAGSSRSCSRSAGRPRTRPATSTARPTPIALNTDELARCGSYQSEPSKDFWAGGSGCRGAALRRRQDHGRRGRDGQGRRHHADPGHQHRRRTPVAPRTAGPDLA